MITAFHIPQPPLDQFIDHFFYYTAFNPGHSVERFLPDGNVQIIFELTGAPKSIYDNDSLEEIQSCTRVWFSGFRTEPITIPSGRESEMAIVQFKRGRAFPFVNAPMQEFKNLVVDAELAVVPEILEIRECLQVPATAMQKLWKLESKLAEYYSTRLTENPFVDFAISKIVSAPSQSSIREISEKAGYSQKHIIKLFKDHVGVSPKDFLKVIRFQKAIGQIEQQVEVDWSAIAFDCGFYDQSHFISDFKVYSGFTPTEYVRQRGEILNYVPVK